MDCWELLNNPTSTTQVQINIQDAIDYPAITFCYKNEADQGYDLRILRVEYLLSAWVIQSLGCPIWTLQYFHMDNYWISLKLDDNLERYWIDYPWGEVDLTTFWTWSTYRSVVCQNTTVPYNAIQYSAYLFSH